MTLDIYCIAGLARAGKTSLLNYVKKLEDTTVLSTSHYLSIKTLEYFSLPVSEPNIRGMQSKDSSFSLAFKHLTGYLPRAAKIHVAEDVIVPELGRYQGLVLPTVQSCTSFNSRVFCEVFNNEELNCWLRGFEEVIGELDYTVRLCSIRRFNEISGVDHRQLMGTDIWNHSTIPKLYGKILADSQTIVYNK